MKVSVILAFATAAMAHLVDNEKRACAGNNCKRQVTGTRDGLLPISSRRADCSSYMQSTVTPKAVTTTVTVTVDPDTPNKFRRRDVNALEYRAMTETGVVPAYASSCTTAGAYEAACSCWGITATTVTGPTPTSTVTSTVTDDGGDVCEDL